MRQDDWVNPYKKPGVALGLFGNIFKEGADALIAAGYRPVPSKDKILDKFKALKMRGWSMEEDVDDFCHWLLEGDKE